MPTTPTLFLSLFSAFRAVVSNRASASSKAKYKLLDRGWGSQFEVWGEKKELCIGGKWGDEWASIEKTGKKDEISEISDMGANIVS